MQPKSNFWNFLLFLVLTLLILVGSTALRTWMQPTQPPRPPQTEVVKLPDSRLWAQLPALASGGALSSAVPGLGSSSQVVTNLALVSWGAQGNRPTEVARKPEPKPEPPKEVVKLPLAKHEQIQLGNDSFKLNAVVTSLGGGIESVTLTKFKAASTMGRPEDTDLHLIPRELNRLEPSFRVFNYAKPEEREDHPLDALGELEWSVVAKQNNPVQDRHEVVLSADVPGQDVRIIKTYSLGKDDYHLGLKLEFLRKGEATEPVKFRYQLTGGHGLPIEGVWYTGTYRNAMVGRLGERNNLYRDFEASQSIGSKPEGRGDLVSKDKANGRIQYAGVAVQYFASVIAVDDQQEQQDFLEWAQPTREGVPNAKKPYLDDITMRVVSEPMTLKPGDRVVHKYLLYNGPVKVRLLGDVAAGDQGAPPELVNRYEYTLHLNTLTDYASPGWMGSFAKTIHWTDLLIYVTNIMHTVLGWLYHYLIPNYGVCIILLTVLVRALMHPVSRKQAKTSIKMQALMPELKKLQEKHKGDRQAMGMAQMELYRKHGVSPVGSCWVVFLQMPIFMGLYYALQESIHFRLAPFLWIKNLAAPDMLIYWGEKIPWISDPSNQGGFFYLGPYFNLLPVVAVALMIVQQKYLMPPPADEQAAMQQKMMKYMMIFFGLMFYKVAAGLCVYFIVSSLWGLAERKLLPKAKPATAAAAPITQPSGASSRQAPARAKVRSSSNGQSNGLLKKVQGMWDELLKQAKKK
jgi:YidC/Oxa1 family membrane protein insertase